MSHSALHESSSMSFLSSAWADRPSGVGTQTPVRGPIASRPISGKRRGHDGSISAGTTRAVGGSGSKIRLSDGRSMGRKGAADTSFVRSA